MDIQEGQHVTVVKVAQGENIEAEGKVGTVDHVYENGAYDVTVGEQIIKAVSVGEISAAVAAEIAQREAVRRQERDEVVRADAAKSQARKPASGFTKPAAKPAAKGDSPKAEETPDTAPAETPAV